VKKIKGVTPINTRYYAQKDKLKITPLSRNEKKEIRRKKKSF
jgi:hypothetical protein